MKLSLMGTSLSIALLAGASSFALPAYAAPTVGSTTTVAKTTYQAQSSELKQIQAWITRNSPEYAPVDALNKVKVTRVRKASSSLIAPSAADGPPVPLPSGGTQGEEITITNTTPDGGSETWAYTWDNGAWRLDEYHWVGPKSPETTPPVE